MSDWEKLARDRIAAFGHIEINNLAAILGVMMREAADARAEEIAKALMEQGFTDRIRPRRQERALAYCEGAADAAEGAAALARSTILKFKPTPRPGV